MNHADRIVHPVQTRCEMTQIVLPGDCNALDTAFGGKVMSWVDVCAAVACQRFARGTVVTAAIDSLSFKAPIRRGKVAVLQATVNRAWRTSMEVGVRVEEEDPDTGDRVHTSTAYLTFVALDAEHALRQVPTLKPVTDIEVRRWTEAQLRREARLTTRDRVQAGRA